MKEDCKIQFNKKKIRLEIVSKSNAHNFFNKQKAMYCEEFMPENIKINAKY